MLTKVIFGTIEKVNLFFNLSWCLFGGLSTLNLYGLYKPDLIIHLYVIISISIFNVFYFLIISGKNYRGKKKLENSAFKYVLSKPNYKIIYLLNIAVVIYSSFFIPKAWMIINSYGYARLRNYAFIESEIYASTLELTIFQSIILPLIIATAILTSIDIALKRSNILMILFTLLNVGIYTFLFAGRGTLVQTMVLIFLAQILLNRKSFFQMLVNNKKYLFLGGILLFISNFLTAERTNSTSSFFEQVVVYLSAPFVFLSNLVEMSPWENNLLYGKATFGFILGPLDMLIAFLFNQESKSAGFIITSITSINQTVGEGVTFNALTTMLFPFMMDFGAIGIFLGPTILAILVATAEIKYKKNFSLFWLGIYMYILYYLPFTVMNYYFLHSATGFVILFLLLFTCKKNSGNYTG